MGGQGAGVGAGAGRVLVAPGPSPSLAGRDLAQGQRGGTPSRDQGLEAEVERRLQSQSRDHGAAARGQSRGPSQNPSQGPDPSPSLRRRDRPAGEKARREMPRSPRVTPNLGPGPRRRRMEIQGDQGPSLRDQPMAMHLLRRMGMEKRMPLEMIDHNLRDSSKGIFSTFPITQDTPL